MIAEKPKEIGEIVKVAKSLEDLERLLEPQYMLGRREDVEGVPESFRFLNFLNRRWETHLRYSDKEPLHSYTGECGLPTLPVEVEGIRYEIHGIVHGTGSPLLSRDNVTKSVRKRIGEVVKGYDKPKNREDYMCEQNLSKIFHLDSSKETKDHLLGREKPSLKSELVQAVVRRPVKLLLLPLTLPLWLGLVSLQSYLGYRGTERLRKYDPENEDVLIRDALKDFDKQGVCFNHLIRREMPQPLELERDYVQEMILRNSLSNPQLADSDLLVTAALWTTYPSVERSLHIAEEIAKRAREDNLRVMHYLCGGGHASEIAFFLQNQDYSFEKLKEKYGKDKIGDKVSGVDILKAI